jgi:nicotinamidase-related amidase
VSQPLPLPPHFDAARVGEVWRVDYAARFEDAARWREEQGIAPAAHDRTRIALVVVDVQNTFCTPGFELFVAGRSGTGALDDSRRLCEFVYRNLGALTQVVATLDTHQALQIFHQVMLVDPEGRPPAPFTDVTAADVEAGRWRFNPDAAEGLGLDPEYAEEHLRYYTETLEQGGKYSLTIWPFHAMLGGIGHALVAAVEEALFFHSVVRYAALDFQPKGDNPLTEHYSMLGPEVEFDREGEPLGRRNHPLLERLLQYDAVVIAGQAKSHCVAWTIQDLLDDPLVQERGLEEKIYLLEDCTSSVVVPGAVDHTDQADAAFARFAAAGAHLVRSDVAMAEWPGVVGEALAPAS